MKKIAILLAWSINNDSRAQRTAASLSKFYDVEIFCLSSNTKQEVPELVSAIPVHRFEETKRTLLDKIYLPFYSEVKSLQAGFESIETKFDIIYCHDLPTLIIGAKHKQKYNVKIVYDIHDLYIETVNQGFDWSKMNIVQNLKSRVITLILRTFIFLMEYKYINAVDLIFSVNESISTYVSKKYRISCEIIQNFPVKRLLPKNKTLRRKLNLPSTVKIVLYHGNLGGGRYLVELVQSAFLFEHNIALVIIGQGNLLNKLKNISNNNTYFLNQVPYENLFEYVSDANLGVVLLEHINYSKKHASANKLFEYMACRLPVLMSNSPELIKVMNSGDIGYIMEEVNPQKIAEYVNEAFRQGSGIYEKGKKARMLYEKSFNWETEEQKLIHLFNQINNDNNN